MKLFQRGQSSGKQRKEICFGCSMIWEEEGIGEAYQMCRNLNCNVLLCCLQLFGFWTKSCQTSNSRSFEYGRYVQMTEHLRFLKRWVQSCVSSPFPVSSLLYFIHVFLLQICPKTAYHFLKRVSCAEDAFPYFYFQLMCKFQDCTCGHTNILETQPATNAQLYRHPHKRKQDEQVIFPRTAAQAKPIHRSFCCLLPPQAPPDLLSYLLTSLKSTGISHTPSPTKPNTQIHESFQSLTQTLSHFNTHAQTSGLLSGFWPEPGIFPPGFLLAGQASLC